MQACLGRKLIRAPRICAGQPRDQVKKEIEQDLFRLAGRLGDRLSRHRCPDRVGADDHVGREPLFTHEIAHPRSRRPRGFSGRS